MASNPKPSKPKRRIVMVKGKNPPANGRDMVPVFAGPKKQKVRASNYGMTKRA